MNRGYIFAMFACMVGLLFILAGVIQDMDMLLLGLGALFVFGGVQIAFLSVEEDPITRGRNGRH